MAVPSSTYRLQITAGFTLFDAAELIGYLDDLGAGAVYLSPLLRATAGSDHGYDVVDHRLVDPVRGGELGLAAVVAAARAAGLDVVVDIVPNHMGVAAPEQNSVWWELLRTGQRGPYGSWFDVDWAAGDGKILIPVLGDDFDAGRDLTIEGDELHYYEHRYPLAEGTFSYDADGGVPASAAEVHERQHYRLMSYRLADTDQNYRRFFAVSDLAGLTVERPEVFDATHAEILRWVHEHEVSGIRIDHPDGLRDPGTYLQRLRAAAPEAWITVEKITEPGEHLLSDWPVAGMTGYDALAEVNAVFVAPEQATALTETYQQVTGDPRDWEQHVQDGKRHIATTILRAEIRRMARLVPDQPQAVAALTELVIAFPVYRSYLPEGAEHLELAVSRVAQRAPELSEAVQRLLPRLHDPADELCWRFQQATGAVTAKGVEDTAYYRYSRLISLNEVGGYPGAVGLSLADFHRAQAYRAEASPTGMTTLSTHDTKRGEDIRARINVLAELIAEFGPDARRLAELAPVPEPAFGYLLWQTLVATGPGADRDRLHAYAEKAMREASDGTRWIDPNHDFEEAVHAAVDAAYDNAAVRDLVTGWHNRIAPYGRSNSFAQKLVQLTMPGVPDVYQGSELAEDSLVDPDNRRPVDYAIRRAALAAVTADDNPPPLDDSAVAKLWLVRQALRARRDRPDHFTGYAPLSASGPAAEHVIGFDRGGAITIATRLPVGLERHGGWAGTTVHLPAADHIDVLTGRPFSGVVPLATLLKHYPGALLIRTETP